MSEILIRELAGKVAAAIHDYRRDSIRPFNPNHLELRIHPELDKALSKYRDPMHPENPLKTWMGVPVVVDTAAVQPELRSTWKRVL